MVYIHTYIPETINQYKTAKDTSAIPSGRTRTGGIQGRRHAATGVAHRDMLKLANPPLICVFMTRNTGRLRGRAARPDFMYY